MKINNSIKISTKHKMCQLINLKNIIRTPMFIIKFDNCVYETPGLILTRVNERLKSEI